MSKKEALRIGYDIGGTKTEIVLMNSKHEVLFKERMPTERDLGYEHILSVLKNLFEICLQKQNLSSADISSIGLALPGAVDPVSQIMLIGNTRILEGKNIKKDLLNILNIDIPISAENDANCFALAECHMGAGKGLTRKNMIGVIIGTGLGGGIVIDGKAYSGKRGSAGEIGHIPFKFENRPCYCGKLDCAELYLSGTGLQRDFTEKTGEQGSASIIFKNQKFLEQYRKDLAFFLAQLANVLDPEFFVLGGGVSRSDVIYDGLEEQMRPHLFYKENPPKVLKHQISDSAGGIGAALLGQF